ncbi:MAG: hypothetical protein OEW37_00640 [Rhodospirillaceae bacterium]|nr:hypothetical protein [Rhodospirillaceae bacterium]
MNADTNKKPMWPQKPDGTTDWDLVFDDPTSGLIAIISKAKTSEALKETTTLVIKKLFTRDDDASEVVRFLAELDNIISKVEETDQLSATIDAVISLLHTIKEERKEQARQYLEKKKLGIATGERRTRRKKNTLTSKIIRAILMASNPKIAIPLMVVLVAIVVGSVAYFASPPKVMPPPEIFKARQSTPKPPFSDLENPDQAKDGNIAKNPAQVTAPADEMANVPSEEIINAEPSTWPRPVLVQPMDWPLIRDSKKDNFKSYATIIYVNSAAGVSAVCVNYPATKESLLVAFGSIGIGNQQPNAEERVKIAAIATKLMNSRFGNFVEYIEVIPYGQKEYRATNTPPCRIAR